MPHSVAIRAPCERGPLRSLVRSVPNLSLCKATIVGVALRRLRRGRPSEQIGDYSNGKGENSPMSTKAGEVPCPFCFPAQERIAFEDKLTMAIWDSFPVSPGHSLIIPRRHTPNWFEATPEEKAELLVGIDRYRKRRRRPRTRGVRSPMDAPPISLDTMEGLSRWPWRSEWKSVTR